MKRVVLSLTVLCWLVVLFVPFAKAGEIDLLVDKLVEKGILTPVEAQIVLDETKQEVAKEIAEAKSDTLPKWIQSIKMKGDFRLRHQWDRRKSSDNRNRARIRFRLGVDAKVTDEVKVGAGLATGGSDPRSTNETLDNNFETPDIRLDYAFAEYEPNNWLETFNLDNFNMKLVGGKFKRKPYLWAPSDLLWDGDINPDGGSVHVGTSLTSNTEGFFNGGVWILDEGSSDESDPYMYYTQGGLKWKEGDFDAKLAFTYYDFESIRDTIPNSAGTGNSTNAVGGALNYDFDCISPAAEFGIKTPFGLPIPRLAFYGEYVNNLDPDDDNTGWLLGTKFGDKKVKKKGNWQFKYMYAQLGADAFPDFLPDSDRYGGATDIKSHEAIFNYALKKNVILGLDYYYSDRMDASSNKENLFQTDLVFKF